MIKTKYYDLTFITANLQIYNSDGDGEKFTNEN